MSPASLPAAPALAPPPVALAPSRREFDYLDKVCLAGTSREFGTTSAPVWQLGIRGRFDPDVAARALMACARRYPAIVARAISMEPGRSVDRAHRLAWETDRTPDWNRLFRVIDAREPGALESVRQSVFNNHLDLEVDYPVRITWARTAADRGVLFVQQHHGLADGLAFFGFLQDFCRFYGAEPAGDAPEVEVLPKLAEEAVAESNRARRLRYRLLGFVQHVLDFWHMLWHPVDLLASNVELDFSGDNRVQHLEVDGAVVERARLARQRAPISLNDLLTGALAMALARWTREHDLPLRRFNLLVLADARPRGATVASFANHLCSAIAEFDLKRLARPLDFARAAREQVGRQMRRRLPVKKLLAEIAVARHVSVAFMRRLIYGSDRVPINLPFSNLVPISPAEPLHSDAWTAESLRIMTPCLHGQGVNVTVIRYAGKLCFNFNHKASAVPTDDVQRLIGHFREAIDEVFAQAESLPERTR